MTSTNSSALYGTFEDGRLEYPIIGGSVSEAAFMTGLERNSDIVFAASYAPLLGVRWFHHVFLVESVLI